MSFSLVYDCYYYPRFLDREVCANGVDPDQMSHYALCVQGLHYFTFYPAMFRQISWFCNGIVKKIGQVL